MSVRIVKTSKGKSVGRTNIPEDLECGVVPRGRLLQKLARLFRPEYDVFEKPIEERIAHYKHRMEIIRTIANCTSTVVQLFLLLKICKVF